MKYYTWSIFLAMLLAITPALFGGGQQEVDETVDLRFTVWSGADAHHALLNEIAADYQEANPNVSVEFSTIPFDDYVPNLTIQLSGSDQPDAGWLTETSAPEFIQAGAAVDLSDAMEAYNPDDWFEPALELWRDGDAIYGVPFSTSPFLIMYNQDIFDDAGVPTPSELEEQGEWTWERFAEISSEIRDTTGIYGFQTMDGQGYEERVWHTLIPIMRSYGGDVWNEDNEILINTDESVQAVELFHSMVFDDESVVPPGDRSDFFAGDAAMTMNQISRVSQLEEEGFDWGMTVLPEGPVTRADVIGQAGIVAYQAGDNPEVAADFAAFMTNEENVARLAEFFPPARESVLESDELLEANPEIPADLMREVVADSIQTGRVLTPHPNFSEIDLESRGAFDDLWQDDADVRDALNGIADVIEPLLTD